MVNIKFTKRKVTNEENNSSKNKTVKKTCPQKNIQCQRCTTKVSTIAALKRHMNSKHTQQVTKYQCRICMKNYCRKDVAARHVKTTHPEEDETTSIQTEVFSPRTTAEKPKKWKPPFEAKPAPLDDLSNVKFRVVAANNLYGNPEKKSSTTTQNPEPRYSHVDNKTLEEDLYLSSDDESVENFQNSHDSILNYATEQTLHENTNVNSSLDETFCQDEIQNFEICQNAQVHSVYGIFQSTTNIYSCYSLSLY
ncbi:uncharacterized protein LOC117321331 [Pecten maximus]|uniref:uncharacterized protein LOC117321331 n=1 Tax=Pecten maximus TaxID=6579 RepID=UPI00145890A2|nr:uncharacterized protein LOC117321331 [Pecten maximus]